MFTYIFWLGLSVWKFPSAQRCFSTALVCGALIPCPKSSSLVTVDKPVSSADGLYGDMPPHVLISSGTLEFISTHPSQQHIYFPGNLSSPNGSHMPFVKLSSWKRRQIILRLASLFSFLRSPTTDFSHVIVIYCLHVLVSLLGETLAVGWTIYEISLRIIHKYLL